MFLNMSIPVVPGIGFTNYSRFLFFGKFGSAGGLSLTLL